MPQRGSTPVIGSPRRNTWPEEGGVKPAKMLRRVDLPQPEAPRMQTISPSTTSSDRCSIATTAGRAPLVKVFERRRAARIAPSSTPVALPGEEQPLDAVHDLVGDEDRER